MSKNKRKRVDKPSGPAKKPGPRFTAPLPSTTKKPSKPAPKSAQHTEPIIPFDPQDRILLVGDGDLSFAQSLSAHHVCTDLTATVYDDETTTLEKYPQAEAHVTQIRDEGGSVLFGVDAAKLHLRKELKQGGFERILFNFPHVGGKSTDVNRQVRYNQEMLVSFFKSTLQLLARDTDTVPTIIVTLFEAEPYTLWNIRDLARHSGLQVQRSFRFQPDAYPGYAHVRTLGNIEGGGGWKGEERAARSYIFEVKDRDPDESRHVRKRKRDSHKDDDDDSSDG